VSILVYESVESRTFNLGENPTGETIWFAQGSMDHADVGAEFVAAVAATFSPDGACTLLLKTLNVTYEDWNLWKAVASYGNAVKQDPKQTGEHSYQFEIGTEQSHVTQSLGTTKYSTSQVTSVIPANVEIGDIFTLTYGAFVATFTATVATVANVVAGLTSDWNATQPDGIVAYDMGTELLLIAPSSAITFTVVGGATDGGGADTQTLSVAVTSPGGTAPDFGGAIGVTKDSVNGVDIFQPTFAFSETHYLPVASVTGAYKLALFAAAGKTNNATFKGFAAGEVIFLGASGGQRGAEDWEISYKFAARQNQASLTIGQFTGIAKTGWQYVWVRYSEAEDTIAKSIVRKPLAVYVETVYDSANFSTIGIGTT